MRLRFAPEADFIFCSELALGNPIIGGVFDMEDLRGHPVKCPSEMSYGVWGSGAMSRYYCVYASLIGDLTFFCHWHGDAKQSVVVQKSRHFWCFVLRGERRVYG